MGKHILIVDRSRTIQMLLSTYFGNAGHHVLLSNMAQEAVGVLGFHHLPPDLIFLAVHAQEKDDYKLIRHVKEQPKYAQTGLVVMVLQEDIAQVQQVLKEVQVSYLPKPFLIQDALALVSVPTGVVVSGRRTEGEGNR